LASFLKPLTEKPSKKEGSNAGAALWAKGSLDRQANCGQVGAAFHVGIELDEASVLEELDVLEAAGAIEEHGATSERPLTDVGEADASGERQILTWIDQVTAEPEADVDPLDPLELRNLDLDGGGISD
jgi:hypothetical protein